jgi:hypothetical protein
MFGANKVSKSLIDAVTKITETSDEFTQYPQFLD